MTFRELVFYTVKGANYSDDISFTLQAFTTNYSAFKDSSDYGTNIQNAFIPINEAIARLSDMEKIQYRIKSAQSDSEGIVDMASFPNKVKEVIAVANSEKSRLAFFPYGFNKINVGENNKPVMVEYKEDLPFFTESDFAVDLYNSYGITNSMCNYIMEYAMGRLTESDNLTASNLHINRSEQYFSNINSVRSAFDQQSIKVEYKIGC